MPDQQNSAVKQPLRQDIIQAISQYLYSVLVAMQQKQPQWLASKYRSIQWSDPKYAKILEKNFTDHLPPHLTEQILLKQMNNYCQRLFTANYLATLDYQRLRQKIYDLVDQYWHQENLTVNQDYTDLNNNLNNNNSQTYLSDHNINQQSSHTNLSVNSIAVLLLDVENLQLDAKSEKFLGENCHYPIQIKIAFANWRSMGKRDVELHERGYQLIHIPPGKDNADLKMATLGSSIFIYYPNTKEVLVCSSDRGLIHLGQTLQNHGMTVYQVRKYKNQITMLNSQTGEEKIHIIEDNLDVPAVDQFIKQLQNLIQQEILRTNYHWVKLSRISALYSETYNLSISAVVTVHFPGHQARDIFINYPNYFAIHKLAENSHLYITNFQMIDDVPLPIDHHVSKNSKTDKTPEPLIADIQSFEDLEKCVMQIINEATASSPDTYIPISHVGSQFYHTYEIPITSLIRRFQSNSKLPKFLQLCSCLKLEKTDSNGWLVAIKS